MKRSQMDDSVINSIRASLRESTSVHERLAQRCLGPIIQAAEMICETLRHGGQIFFFGNGGSAADAQHLAAELVGRFGCERRPLPALALTTDTSLLTAVGNDYGFEQVFSRQIDGLASAGDVAIAISTSGNSSNVVRALRAAREKNVRTIGFTGEEGGEMRNLVNLCIKIPSASTARIQEAHITVGHLICEAVEAVLFPDAVATSSASRNGIEMPHSKVVTWESLLQLRETWRQAGLTVVWTNGCFELLHIGHIQSLAAARALGDVLVVGVNSDSSVALLKGEGRPLIPASERSQILASLENVNAVVEFDESTPERALERLQPEIHCKRAHYAPPDEKPNSEVDVVTSYGGSVKVLPLVGSLSMTRILEQISGTPRTTN